VSSCILLKRFVSSVGINSVRQMEIFRVLSGILHLGNVTLDEDKKADTCYVPVRTVSSAVISSCVLSQPSISGIQHGLC